LIENIIFKVISYIGWVKAEQIIFKGQVVQVIFAFTSKNLFPPEIKPFSFVKNKSFSQITHIVRKGFIVGLLLPVFKIAYYIADDIPGEVPSLIDRVL